MTGMDRFHAHLDVCARCAKNPFDLCAQGRILLLLCAPVRTIPRTEVE